MPGDIATYDGGTDQFTFIAQPVSELQGPFARQVRWCREPDEQDTETTLVPEAVVEIISKDYAAKDLVIGVPFYQRVGIPDIIVFDPETDLVRHWRNGGNEKSYPSPVTIDLLCGCSVTV